MEDITSEVVIEKIVPSSNTLQFITVEDKKDQVINQEGKQDPRDNIAENQADGINLNTKRMDSDEIEKEDFGSSVELDSAKVLGEFFRCDICNKDFESMNDLQSHANTIHLNLPATCPLPQSVAIPKKKRRRKKKKEPWLSRLAEIRKTIPSHNGENGSDEKHRIWECELCRNSFNRKDHLAKHIAFVHERIRPYECEICGHQFSQKHHVAQHIQSKHEDDENRQKPLACEMCGKRFARKEHVENHIKLVHEKRKPFECGVCKKKFSQKHHFLNHVYNIHGVKNSPSLIPTEREIKLKMNIGGIENDDRKVGAANIMPSDIAEKQGEKINHDHQICEAEDSKVAVLKRSVDQVEKTDLETMLQVQGVEKSEQELTVNTMKYNPHVCPFCEQSFKQLPHLGAHIMAVHEPPTKDTPTKRKIKLTRNRTCQV